VFAIFLPAAGNLTINNSIIGHNVATNSKGVGAGGGIANSGTATINNSTLYGNTVNREFGAGFGAGFYNAGTATIKSSTLWGNFATGWGGGIHNYAGNLTITNSTLSGNGTSTIGRGGGIYNHANMAINNSTISGNKAPSGGGIYNSASTFTVTLQNSIVANSPSGGDCTGTMTSKGYNLSSDGTCNFNNSGDRRNTDPKLGLLQNNGGPALTQALLTGSPAIDAGNPSGCTSGNGVRLKTDQRGKPRPDLEDTGGCDMCAYERQSD